jgi:hypothetical protein
MVRILGLVFSGVAEFLRYSGVRRAVGYWNRVVGNIGRNFLSSALGGG